MNSMFVDYPINYGISLRYRSPLRVRQPVTTVEREALRSTTARQIARPVSRPYRPFEEMLMDVVNEFYFLVCVPLHQRTMCRNYGHVLHTRRFHGNRPLCVDCGKTIYSKDDLRTAVPKSELRKLVTPVAKTGCKASREDQPGYCWW